MTKTYTGSAGDGDMNNPANWQDGQLPQNGDDVIMRAYGNGDFGSTWFNSVTFVDPEPSFDYLESAEGIRQAAREALGDEWDGIDLRPVDQPIIR